MAKFNEETFSFEPVVTPPKRKTASPPEWMEEVKDCVFPERCPPAVAVSRFPEFTNSSFIDLDEVTRQAAKRTEKDDISDRPMQRRRIIQRRWTRVARRARA